MAKKKLAAVVKIQIPAGGATPAPPVGTALGPHGVAIMDFCKAYNAQTESQRGTIIPVEISIFEDRTFTFITKTPPTSVLLREAAKLDIGGREGRFLPRSSPRPDVTFADRMQLDVGGLRIELRHARGETDDHLWAWLPDRKTICAGDFFIWCFPSAGFFSVL